MMCQALKQMLREYYCICFDLHIELGHKKKKIKPWHDCAKNIFELESINAVLEKYVNCSIYGDILYATFKY